MLSVLVYSLVGQSPWVFGFLHAVYFPEVIFLQIYYLLVLNHHLADCCSLHFDWHMLVNSGCWMMCQHWGLKKELGKVCKDRSWSRDTGIWKDIDNLWQSKPIQFLESVVLKKWRENEKYGEAKNESNNDVGNMWITECLGNI